MTGTELQDCIPAALFVKKRLSDLGEAGSQLPVDNSLGDCLVQRGADVDHRFRRGGVTELLRAVQHRDFVVVGQDAVAVGGENSADTYHAEMVELGGAQCADTGAAV